MDDPRMDVSSEHDGDQLKVDVLVVGAGPSGAAAASWAARSGRDVLLVDMAQFPRDKTCGDGLTPRAVAELNLLGLSDWVLEHPVTRGLHVHGWERDHRLPWNGRSFPNYGSVITRTELDHRLVRVAGESGARTLFGYRAAAVSFDGDRIASVELRPVSDDDDRPVNVVAHTILVADGVRSKFGSLLGRQWHRESVYGTAMRAFMRVDRQSDWLVAHLGPPMPDETTLPGYGWIFPLGQSCGNGQLDAGSGPLVNVGVIAYAAKDHELRSGLLPLLDKYVADSRDEFGLRGSPMQVKSALLPLGGAVSHIAGRNWMLLGDAAGCVNPFTGEGIDYALETGRFAVEHLDEADHSVTWPHRLNYEYGPMFAATRRFARGFFKPWAMNGFGQHVMKSRRAMTTGIRLMSNLVGPDDKDLPVRLARIGGSVAQRREARRPFLTPSHEFPLLSGPERRR
ncbi:geranylgeranyl reductase family protein [Mycobacteroides abscessus]|uniref:geranylgeranyl reductase family protein n=1 Tax=Mycobacteroides abscessus TaxID=36809 RepID=UPI00092CBF28|nr:geranylgeranyl reductase family protein [Mycobacteroides abscessus]SKS08297.1 oxidoreductase [Mycobacteroides abscessus subsp. abscessus]SHU86754.1 oxidoreductase [Mycobacteroides abscessus subsp. bolletii]SHW21933.1 oxidoreductase [Mycobacteroides abscessus subsp. bolletii]SHW47767.1 oxidoreductase [Mycobacteroides abscessus subsp. bolletii]SHX92126.1 oxidoreductase [Mycobacteroides abscessus subsp. bolletii]